MKKIGLILCLCMVFCGMTHAQKVLSTQNVSSLSQGDRFIGYHNNKEYWCSILIGNFGKPITDLYIYENGEKIVKKDATLTLEDKKHIATKIILTKDGIVITYIINQQGTEGASMYVQKYDFDINAVGTPVKVFDIVDNKNTSSAVNMLTLGFVNRVEKQTLDIIYNSKAETYLFTYSLKLRSSENQSYSKLILTGSDFKVLNSYDYAAESGTNETRIFSPRVFDNGDAYFILFELKDKSLLHINVINLPIDGKQIEPLELVPDKNFILSAKIVDKVDKEGNITYAILSKDEDLKNTATISIYK